MSEVMEQVRRKLDGALFIPISCLRGSKGGEGIQTYISGTSRDELIKGILAIPELLIKDLDQILPANPYGARTNQEVYQRAIEDFKKKGNWVKVLSKEEKSNGY